MRVEESKECYELEPGTPTLTLERRSLQRMIPYSSFGDAIFLENHITLRFHDWVVEINGTSLEGLWQHFQMQDVRVVRTVPGEPEFGSVVNSINITAVEE